MRPNISTQPCPLWDGSCSRDLGQRRRRRRGLLRALVPQALLLILCPSPAGAEGVNGFVRDTTGTFTIVALPGSHQTEITTLNDSGEAAGFYTKASGRPHGLLRDATGAITTVDTPGSTNTQVTALNYLGQAAGSYIDAGGFLHGYLRDATGAITTVDVPGRTGTEVYALNDSGQASDTYNDASGQHGYLRDASGSFATIAVPGNTDTVVTTLNGSGETAGYYFTINSLVPEPPGVVLLGTGLVVLLGYALSRRRAA